MNAWVFASPQMHVVIVVSAVAVSAANDAASVRMCTVALASPAFALGSDITPWPKSGVISYAPLAALSSLNNVTLPSALAPVWTSWNTPAQRAAPRPTM